MKKCKYCNGTGIKRLPPIKTMFKHITGFDDGQPPRIINCPKCYGKGIK